jgi:hypothetical protein
MRFKIIQLLNKTVQHIAITAISVSACCAIAALGSKGMVDVRMSQDNESAAYRYEQSFLYNRGASMFSAAIGLGSIAASMALTSVENNQEED